MNTTLQAALLLPFLAGSLSAQDLRLEATMTPAALTARVEGAQQGDLVVLVLGLRETPYKLPGGQILGVTPDLVSGFAIADATGTAKLGLRLPRNAGTIDCFAQAVGVSPRLPLDAPGGITVSKVQHLRSAVPVRDADPGSAIDLPVATDVSSGMDGADANSAGHR